MEPEPAPESTADALERELRTLKRGRGIAADQIVLAAGPHLRDLCDFRATDDPETLRIKLKAQIVRASIQLPADERHLALVALGIDPAAQHRFLKQRLQSTLQALDRDAIRTPDRLANRGLRRIAECLVRRMSGEPNPYVTNGWFTESLDSTVRLDLERPELHEHRRIVPTRAGVDRLLVSLTVPIPAGTSSVRGSQVEIRTGGTALAATEISPGLYQGVMPLPRILREGEPYEYDVTFVLAQHSLMRPYYLLTPLRHCQDFRLRVCFDPDRLPGAVWRIDGVPRAVAEAAGTPDSTLGPGSGEASARFRALHPGLSYGVRWSARAT
jgi:hypothetical protein